MLATHPREEFHHHRSVGVVELTDLGGRERGWEGVRIYSWGKSVVEVDWVAECYCF
jgi:hypothetical protein